MSLWRGLSASHSYIALLAKNRTEIRRFGKNCVKFFWGFELAQSRASAAKASRTQTIEIRIACDKSCPSKSNIAGGMSLVTLEV
jgi:hypothetical protein